MPAFGIPLAYDRASVARLATYLDYNRAKLAARWPWIWCLG